MHRIVCIVAILAAGCTVGGGDPPAESPMPDGGLAPVRLALEPSEVVLESVDGDTPSVTFRAVATMLDGEEVEIDAQGWQQSHDRLGTLSDRGTFEATGRAGGTVEVSASIPGATGRITATAQVTVLLDVTVPPDESVPAEVVEAFEHADEIDSPFDAVTIAHPFEGAHLPNNVSPPDVQWHPVGGPGDAFRVTFSTEETAVRAYAFDHGEEFGSRLRLDRSAFRYVADSARGAEVTIQVDRLPPSRDRVIRGFPVTVYLSEDGLFGTLYYWQVREVPQASDVFRIDAATGERTSVFEPSTGTCVGCHALSQDGRKLAATRGGTAIWDTAVVDATSDTTPPGELLEPMVPSYNLLAWSPGGDRVLGSRSTGHDRNDTRLYLLDGYTGTEVEATGLPEEIAGYPAWSPNGALVAWMQGGGDGPAGTTAATRIVVADADGGDAFVPRVLHDGVTLEDAHEGGVTDSHPTFSPDSRYLAFAHGTSSVSSTESWGSRPRSGLYLVSVEGGDAIRLDRGVGKYGPVDAFWPVFSPFATQEPDGRTLYWLAFYSRQDYGNELAGTRGTGRRQLWVMAIDPALAAEGLDPSHPPYWLPGQDTSAEDIAALWAPTACRGRGESCSASSECCSGECAAGDPARPDELTCQAPLECRQSGESCETADDCCAGLECNLSVCGYEPPL